MRRALPALALTLFLAAPASAAAILPGEGAGPHVLVAGGCAAALDPLHLDEAGRAGCAVEGRGAGVWYADCPGEDDGHEVFVQVGPAIVYMLCDR